MSVNIDEIVARILAELRQEGLEPKAAADASGPSVINRDGGDLVIDLADPTLDAPRHAMLVDNPYDADGLRNLMATTSARLGVGRAGPRPRTATALLFQADHGVTQDAIYGVVSDEVRDAFDLFTVTTRVADRGEYLLRPDLGRLLSDEGKKLITERCVKGPDVQLCVVDGLSAAAIDNNLRDIYPVIEQGLKSAGLSVGTPFFIENGRVGIMNDVNSIIKAKVVVLLIGERPGHRRRHERLHGLRPAAGQVRRRPRPDLHDHHARRHQPARGRRLHRRVHQADDQVQRQRSEAPRGGRGLREGEGNGNPRTG
jgi:ethanolamine ammonia-lyase small subunit